MKNIKLVTCLILSFSLLYIGCKKEKPASGDVTLTKKYAKYKTAVYKTGNLSKWVATLSKAEPVDLLEETEKIIKKRKNSISKIRLSDDTIAYITSERLADKPIVFIKDTKVYIRNNKRSSVKATIPVGTIAFIVGEKGDWVQVYAGKINGTWITKQWVHEGYSTDNSLILDGRTYEEAMETMNRPPSEVKEEEMKNAIRLLEELKDRPNIFGEFAAKQLNSEKEKPAEEKTEADAKEEKSSGEDKPVNQEQKE